LLEAVEDIEMLFHSIAHRHTALLISLRNNGVLTAAQYEETLTERQAALERGHEHPALARRASPAAIAR
jgi:hypothetical protein